MEHAFSFLYLVCRWVHKISPSLMIGEEDLQDPAENCTHGCHLLQRKIQSKVTKGYGEVCRKPRHKLPRILSQQSNRGNTKFLCNAC